VVKLPEVRKGFVLLPRLWVVERSFGLLARYRRLSCDFERMPQVLASLRFLVFAVLMLPKAVAVPALGQSA
jgi:transposase